MFPTLPARLRGFTSKGNGRRWGYKADKKGRKDEKRAEEEKVSKGINTTACMISVSCCTLAGYLAFVGFRFTKKWEFSVRTTDKLRNRDEGPF